MGVGIPETGRFPEKGKIPSTRYNLRMRIVIDSRLPFYQRGGISQYILHLLPALAKVDTENHYTILHMRQDPADYTPDQPNFLRANALTPCHHRFESAALGVELLRFGADIVHSPDFIPPRFAGRRRVITVHDLNFLFFPQFLTAESLRYYAGQIDRAVLTADHISADSENTRQDLIDILGVPPEKVSTVYLSVNPVYQKPYSESEINHTLDKCHLNRGFILAVGTLEPRKNYPLLLKAYRLLRDENMIEVPLVLVGRKGWLADEISETITKLKLEGLVRHLTGIFDEALAHLYHAAGVLVTPSHYEGFGLPALEALNCGCPVVVSDQGSLPEIAGDAGLVLPPEDPAAWAAALADVLHNAELRQQMIKRGFAHAKTFSWQTAARQTLDIYKLVAAA